MSEVRNWEKAECKAGRFGSHAYIGLVYIYYLSRGSNGAESRKLYTLG